ncbi:MAG: hypothetical protein KC419_11585 [Anaerolineales bacterium]|nr:hypothetical protein [Anaerolineales bacterium]
MVKSISNKEQFTLLLKRAIERINQLTGKQFQAIRQELSADIGRKVYTIEYWERVDNHTLPRQTELEGLADSIYRQLLDRNWLDAFLFHGKHPDADTYSRHLTDKYDEKQPSPRADKLVGRSRHIDAICKNLKHPSGDVIITIDGLGGIGKTAIASKIHDLFVKDAAFDKIIWISADRSDIPIFLKSLTPFNFETVLDGIGQQLGEHEIKKLPMQQKAVLVNNLLQKHRCLVILDNMETADMPQHEIVEYLRPFLHPSRALFTSRRRFTGNHHRIHLPGLAIEPAVELMHHWGTEKAIPAILQGTQANLHKIYHATGGSPLAIKLIVSLLQQTPLDAALAHLEKATPLDRLAGEDEYVQFYRYIFLQTWQLLKDGDEKLLIGLAQFDPSESIPYSLIKAMPELTTAQITTSLQFLWRLSLLEVKEQNQSADIFYNLHPLTRAFVLSDMVKQGGFS